MTLAMAAFGAAVACGVLVWSAPRDTWRERVLDTLALQPLSPLVVTVYERWTSTTARDNAYVAVDDQRRPISIDYAERLVVVKPQNWTVYTNDGIHFYLLTANLSNRNTNCDLDTQSTAIELRLATKSDDKEDERLRFACLNYTQNNLTRVFGSLSDRTYIDLSNHFDGRTLTVQTVLDYLLQHRLV